MLLGISEESKAYRLYNPITKKIITSRDVIFDENKSWNWNKEHVVTVLEWGDNDEEAIVSDDGDIAEGDGDIAEEAENAPTDIVNEGRIVDEGIAKEAENAPPDTVNERRL